MTSPTRLSGWWDLGDRAGNKDDDGVEDDGEDGAGNKDDDGEEDCGKRWNFFASGCGSRGFLSVAA